MLCSKAASLVYRTTQNKKRKITKKGKPLSKMLTLSPHWSLIHG